MSIAKKIAANSEKWMEDGKNNEGSLFSQEKNDFLPLYSHFSKISIGQDL